MKDKIKLVDIRERGEDGEDYVKYLELSYLFLSNE